MSLVLNILSDSKSYVAYDGRAKRDGRIISETVVKAEMVNRQVCIGFTGILELASDVMRALRTNVVGIEQMPSNAVAAAVLAILKLPNAPKFSGTFLITGINEVGQMASYTIAGGLTVSSYIAEKGELRLIQLGGDSCDTTFSEFCKLNACGQGEQAIMREFIEHVAQHDDSVNSNVRFLVLDK